MDQQIMNKKVFCDLPEEFQDYMIEEFEIQAHETTVLRIELDNTKGEIDKINSELELTKSELQIQKQINKELMLLNNKSVSNMSNILKPLLERQINEYHTQIPYMNVTPLTNIVENDMEMDESFYTLPKPLREKGIGLRSKFF
jgi:hypothetical protein